LSAAGESDDTLARVAVIGAGPAGMSAAYVLSREGVKVDVYEASDKVGGMARSIDLWNQRVDIGPHRFFSNDRRVNELWLELVGRDYRMVNRLTRIYYGGRFYHYPLKPLNALQNLGLVQATLCTLSFMKEKVAPTPMDGSFRAWVTQRFGRRLFEIFFKTYSEKLWGITCDELDSDFAAQRIKKLSLFEAVWNAVVKGGASKHKTLVDQFAYPIEGTGMVYERMAQAAESRGSSVQLRAPVRRVLTEGGAAVGVELMNGEIRRYAHVVSTMPLTLLVRGLESVPAEVRELCDSLKFRNTIIVFLRIESADLFPDQWLYVHAGELKTGRITNFRNWVPELHGSEQDSIIAMEFWCYDDDPIWKEQDSALVDMARDELRRTGLDGGATIPEGTVYRVPRCYPVYDRGYRDRLRPVETYLGTIERLHVIGRYGAFKYNNQDHSILMGLLAAENILADAGHDLWEINTDYETYQESATINETGLVVGGAA
jgi:protoporphyrinogen oxidase